MITVILLSLVGAVIAAVLGTLWYSNATPMGKIHMKYLGFDKLSEEEKKKKMAEAKPTMARMYAAQMILSLVMSFAVVFIVTEGHYNGVPLPIDFGFIAFNWLCFVVPTIGTGILWSNCDPKIAWQKFFSDICYNFVLLFLVALVTSFFV